MEAPQSVFSPWNDVYQSQCSNSLKMSSLGVECASKIFNLQVELLKEIVHSTAEAVKNLNDVKNPQGLSDFHETLTKPTLEKSVATSNAIYEILADTQQKILALSLTPLPEVAHHPWTYHLSRGEATAMKKSSQRAAEQL